MFCPVGRACSRFFIDNEGEKKVPGQGDICFTQCMCCVNKRSDLGLRIGSANTVEPPLFYLSSPRITSITTWFYRIHVSGENEGFRTLSGPGKVTHHIRALR